MKLTENGIRKVQSTSYEFYNSDGSLGRTIKEETVREVLEFLNYVEEAGQLEEGTWERLSEFFDGDWY